MILRPYKRIKELEEMVDELKRDYNTLKEREEERLEKKRNGLHNPTALCAGCKNFVAIRCGYPYGCKLDNKCEDWEEINSFQTNNV